MISYALVFLSDRFLRLFFRSQDEPRYKLWINSLEFIEKNPFGYELESSWGLIGYTPHNLYLETLLSSGVFGLSPLILMVMVWLNLVFKIKQLWAMSFAMVGISVYFLMRTQIGMAIGSSYDFFTAMMIAVFCLSKNRNLQFQIRKVTEGVSDPPA